MTLQESIQDYASEYDFTVTVEDGLWWVEDWFSAPSPDALLTKIQNWAFDNDGELE